MAVPKLGTTTTTEYSFMKAICQSTGGWLFCRSWIWKFYFRLRLALRLSGMGLARKVETEVDESWYGAFYHYLRMEMDEYRRLKRNLRVLKSYTDYEEDLYEEAV